MATLTESEGARAAGDLVRARETAEWGFSRSRVVNNPVSDSLCIHMTPVSCAALC